MAKDMDTYFPCPAQQTAALLDSCRDDLDKAWELGVINADIAPDYRQKRLWVDVLHILFDAENAQVWN